MISLALVGADKRILYLQSYSYSSSLFKKRNDRFCKFDKSDERHDSSTSRKQPRYDKV